MMPLGNSRSLPAQVGSSAPLDAVQPPRRLEFPQGMSLSVPELAIPPMEPTNDSPLSFRCDPSRT
jgi:hypothetical protein